MREITVYSDRELTELEINHIKGIFKESLCPNESLINTIKGYTSYVEFGRDGKCPVVKIGEDADHMHLYHIEA